MARTKASARRAENAKPGFITPCLARLGEDVPAGANWVHEVKLDGYRLQVHLDNGAVRLLTRTGLDWTPRFGSLVTAFKSIPAKSAILDGEVIVEDDRGASSFVRLVSALKANTTEAIVFVAFDLLFLDGIDLTVMTLTERKMRLQALLPNVSGRDASARILYSEHLAGDGEKILSSACKLGLEGIVSKRLDKPYRSGRHDDWRKTKCVQTDEFIIVGYLDSTALKESIGALAVGYYDDTKLIYAGRVGTGFSHATAAMLWKALQPLRTETSSLVATLDGAQLKGVNWVVPDLVAQLEYRALTDNGLLRHASFQALREDKPPSQVTRPRLARQPTD